MMGHGIEPDGPRYPYLRRMMPQVRLGKFGVWALLCLAIWGLAYAAFARDGDAPPPRACAPECPLMCQDAPGEPDARWPVCAVPISTNDAREEK